MLRKLVCAVAILGLSIGLAVAEEIKGKIAKINGTTISFQAFNKDTKTYGDAKDYTLADGVKVSKMVKKEKVAVEGGLKSDDVKIGDKGLNATINVDDTTKKVTEIILGGGKKKAAQ